MAEIFLGMRVVRGRDWRWNAQDGGEGHVGTIVEIGRAGSPSSPDKTVIVQWDMGSRTNYRVGYQDAYDLLVFDNAPSGIRHANVICDGCKDHGISGILWKCARCLDKDFCNTCYMNDTHDLSHPFRRFDTASSVGVDVLPRLETQKIVSKGIFAGARVVRGPDWDWGNQDGGEGKIGRVVDIRGWDNDSGRSVANVIWASGSTNVYRLGHKGKVDLRCVSASSAGSYYVHHLPILGLPSSTSLNCNSLAGSTKGSISGKTEVSFNVGDKVQVIHELSKLRTMQQEHGGWNPKMAEFIGKSGIVHRVTDKGDIRVQYESGIRWTFNPNAVTKVTTFSAGDIVQVLNDYGKVKELQKGHGEFVDAMKDILGRTGTVAKVYADADLRINFTNSTWTMNPLAVRMSTDRIDTNNSMYAVTNRRDDNMRKKTFERLDDLSLDDAVTVERFVREAAQGRIENVKKMLPKMKERINHKDSGKTPLQVSAHQGHADIVALLIQSGANLEVTDEDGDTALHYSAFGNQPHVMEILLKAGSLVNAINRGQCSALHVAVNKQFVECVKVLMKFKCNINIQDNYGDTCLFDAIGFGFRSPGVTVKVEDGTAISGTDARQNETQPNPNRKLQSPIHLAVEQNNREIVDCLINSPGVDFTLRNNRGFNLLHHAALKGSVFAVERILGKARQLVDVKKDDGFASIHLACLNGHYDVTKVLVEEGSADIDIRNNRKQTPLLLAVSQGYCGLVEYLVSKGCTVSVDDEDGDSPLHVILTRHFDNSSNQQHSQAQAHLANPVTAVELRKHDNAPTIAEIWSNLLTCGWSVDDDDIGPATLACFMALAGADLSKKNRRGVTPFDLVKNERLKEMLCFYAAKKVKLSHRDAVSGNEDKSTKGKRSSPAQNQATGGVVVGSTSAGINAPVVTAVSLSTELPRGECVLCSELSHIVTFEPCGHRIACEECCVRMKKCLTCQQQIDKKISWSGMPVSSSSTSSLRANPTSERLRYLENKFAEIEENFSCQICMERRRNVAFLCGHGACASCSQNLTNCHMCRVQIIKKILLF